ncbi:MAG: histidine kinase famiy protein, partial [Acetobacteraceae bacterium]
LTGYPESEVIGRNCRFLQGPDTDRDAVAGLRRAIAERREHVAELLNYRRDGSSFWNLLFIAPVHTPTGELVYFYGSQLDVSRRRDMEETLRQAQKMEALGQFTGSVAHDFNNLLQVILGYLDPLEDHLPATGEAREALVAVRGAAERAASLTGQLLAFARQQRLQGRVVNLNVLLRGIEPLARRTLGPSIHLSLDLEPGLANSRIDPVQAEMAVLNILANARDACGDAGRVRIVTRTLRAEDPLPADLGPGAYVEVAISDNGHGMDRAVLAHALDPFFTTKEPGRGTGLGLSMVYGFLKQSGGTVTLGSEPGEGTTVRLFFPATAELSAPPVEATEREVADRGTGELVLVVEDQPDVAALAQSILVSLGYRVILAANAREALHRLEATDGVALVFSDVIMAGEMNGVMLAHEIRRRRPGLPVLLATGFATGALAANDPRAGGFEVLSKPYRRGELARAVRKALDGAAGRA